MVETPPAPRRRRRPTILTTMAAVALVAVALGVIRAHGEARDRQVRLALLRAELAGAQARMFRSQAMQMRGAASAEQAAAAWRAMEKARAELKAFEGR